MKNKRNLLLAVLAIVLLIGGAYLLYDRLSGQFGMPQLSAEETPPAEESPAGEQPGEGADGEPAAEEQLAPDFTVYDRDGNPVKLSDFRGKPVVLNFWSSRCGPCKSEMPDFQQAYDQLGEEIHFLMVNVTDGSWDTMDSATAFLDESGYTFPVYFDTGLSASAAYGTSSLPVTYFIDAEGRGIAYGRGAMDMETLMTGIGMIRDLTR